MTDSKQKTYPILIALTKETRPGSITMYGLTGGRFQNVRLPKRLTSLNEDTKQAAIRWCIKKYLKRFNGYCMFWGKVIGFQYFDSSICYNINVDATSFVKIDASQKVNGGVAYASIR